MMDDVELFPFYILVTRLKQCACAIANSGENALFELVQHKTNFV